MSGERVLLTGAKGYLGGRLMSELAGTVPLCADITDTAAIAAAFADAGAARSLIHLAGANEIVCANDLARSLEVNAIGTRNVLDAAAASGVRRVIFFSTFHVYGEPTPDSIITELTLADPIHPYGMTKLLAEQLCKAARKKYGFELAIVRLSNSVGMPADAEIERWTLVVLDLCRQAHEKRSLRLVSSGVQRRDFISIGDIAQATRILLHADAQQLQEPVFNLGSGSSVRIRDIAAWIQEEYERMYGARIPLSAPHPTDPAPANFCFSISKIMTLGFAPQTNLREEIRSTLKFCERFAA